MIALNSLFKALAVLALSMLAAVEKPSTPMAAIALTTSTPAANAPVQFVDASEGAPTSWRWDFGDGMSSQVARPSHVYAAPGTYVVSLRVGNGASTTTATRVLTVVAEDTLRLIAAHPFDITLTATDPRTGTTGQGQVIAQNDIYGIFSIPAITGNAGNPEVIVKMVDASGIGQSYWVFYGALTDLNYTLSVRDVATGTTKTYHDARVGSTVCGQFDTSGFGAAAGATAGNAVAMTRVAAPGSSAPLTAVVVGADSLRLMASHPFDVTLTATDPRTGHTGQGQLLAQTDIYGIFSIPAITGNASNPEVIVKMVDASGIGQNYWVFYGALTDLNYTLSVREASTGRIKTYADARLGNTVCGQFDTSGFLQAQVPTPTPGTPSVTPTPTPPPTPTPQAATAWIVNVAPNGFVGFVDASSGTSTSTIHVGDTVKWEWQGNNHSSTSGTCTAGGGGGGYYDPGDTCNADGTWDSGLNFSGASFTHTFTAAGTFRYYCSNHKSMMTGTVKVNP